MACVFLRLHVPAPAREFSRYRPGEPAWYAVAKVAGIPNPATIRDIEYGRDAKLSNIEAVAAALGLRLELVEQDA